jgi:Yip1 domain
MTESTSGAESAGAAATPPKNLAARMFGVLFAPRATYASVAAHPRALGVLIFVVLFGAVGTYTFLSTEVGRTAMLEQQVESMKSFGVNVTDQMIDRMEQGAERGKYFGAVGQAVFFPLAGLVIAAIAFAVFNAIMGGDATFKQVFAIVAHSAVIFSVSQAFGLPLAYAREKLSGATNLAVFTPFLDDASFAARMLGAIDLFIIWWIVSLAIGLGVLYKRRTAPIATTLIVIYVAIGVVIAAVKTALAGA